MGLVLLDFTFRIERQFKIRIPRDWHRTFWESVVRGQDMSLEEFHRFVLQLCSEQGATPPSDSMDIIIREAEGATGESFTTTGPSTLIHRHIAPSG